MGVQVSLSSWHSNIGIPINFHEESDIITFWTPRASRSVKSYEDPIQMRRAPRSFPKFFTKFSYIALSYAMKDEPEFKTLHGNPTFFRVGHLSIHSTWGSKLRDPLKYLMLREGYSWSACGKLAYFFNRVLEICSLLEMIWHPWSFPRVPVLKLVFL